MDYAFTHDGKAFTPNQTDIAASEAESHNAALLALELERWNTLPDRQLAYFHFPSEKGGGQYRQSFYPNTRGAYVTLWPGNLIGRIVSASVHGHNFGGRMVSLTVEGTNGAKYYGRASYDNGTCIWLRKAR
jgi:hypothetical protein